MNTRIVDTTLRDGEQKAGIAFSIEDKVEIAKLINAMNIYQIEAGIPAMGGDEKESIKEIVKLGLKSKISAWNRMNIKDINESMECKVDIIHISVPASDLQIQSKLGKTRSWVIENLIKCVDYATSGGYEITVGLEDASRADMDFLIELSKIVFNMGVKRVRYADTVGILYPRKCFYDIKEIINKIPIDIEAHMHNDFGMAMANSMGALDAGAKYVDCTISGTGERAGNCNYSRFVKVLYELTGEDLFSKDYKSLTEKEENIKHIMRYGIEHLVV